MATTRSNYGLILAAAFTVGAFAVPVPPATAQVEIDVPATGDGQPAGVQSASPPAALDPQAQAPQPGETGPVFPQQPAKPSAPGGLPPGGTEVVLRGLDKIGAKVTTLDVPIGQSVDYGNLVITARYCRSAPPTEPPETKAFLEIDEVPPGEKATRIFTGWMFASSPALSALEHPVYDVWVLNCKMSSGEASSGSE